MSLLRINRQASNVTAHLHDQSPRVANQPASAQTGDMSRGSIAGFVAAAVALSLGELVTAASASGPSLLGAVGDQFIDLWGAQLKDIAVAIFGANHKLALNIAMLSVALGIGSALGHVSRSGHLVARLGFGIAAIFGLWAYLIHPLGNFELGLLATAIAYGSGLIVLRWLKTPQGTSAANASAEQPVTEQPGTGTADRRRFLQTASAVLVGAGAIGVLGIKLRGREFVSEARQIWQIPLARRAVSIPSGASLPVAGITPYITPIEDFFRIDTALRIPRVDAATWKLRLTGMVEDPFEITFDELLAMDAVQEPITLQCVSNVVGGDLVGTAIWQGVPLTALLDRARPNPRATQVIGESVDAFTAGFPTELLLDGRSALVAYAMNGELLPIRHGFPARLVVSGLYGYVSATKWLREIRLTTWEAEDGYWMPRGWSKKGPIKMASRIDLPRRNQTVTAGAVIVAGIALSPSVGIAAVEVQVDDGPWQLANLGEVASEHTWVQWWWDWEATPGEHLLKVRAIDVTGMVQTDVQAEPAPNGSSGWHQRRVKVS
jgi:DMSO/TMAO reductase YedYZ molybdopterin-dependent catalytic subunit